MVRNIIDNYTKITPAILEIPSKEHAYDPSRDSILKRAQVFIFYQIFFQDNRIYITFLPKKMFSAEDFK
jgi:hypothetical protein